MEHHYVKDFIVNLVVHIMIEPNTFIVVHMLLWMFLQQRLGSARSTTKTALALSSTTPETRECALYLTHSGPLNWLKHH